MRSAARMVLTVTALLVGPAASLAEAADPPALRSATSTAPLGNERLSDERSLSRWAHVNLAVTARKRPSTAAQAIGRLKYQTPEGLAEVLLALESRVVGGRTWIRVRLPVRPNGTTGWVPEDALGPLRVTRDVFVVDRARFRATLRRGGRVLWTSRIGTGKKATPTPGGHFIVRQRIANLKGSPIYGPWAFGTSAQSVLSDWPGGGVVGIHGTNQPGLLPGRVSHGCIRVPNAAIRRLARLMKVGTPVHVR